MKTIPDASTFTTWRKSSYSNGEGGDCVEIADGMPGVMPVRDSKTPTGPALVFASPSWSSFLSAVKDTELPSV